MVARGSYLGTVTNNKSNHVTVCQNLIRGILTWEPQQRLKVSQMLNHPWLENSGPKESDDAEVRREKRII